MKTFFLTLSLLISTLASAASVKVFEISGPALRFLKGEFAMNEQLGRVWVEIEVVDFSTGHDEPASEYYRTKVEGLELNKSLGKATLTVDGAMYECASIKQGGILIFRHNYLKTTDCKFTSKVVTESVDDGFEIKKIQKLQVFLVTK
jgi:hypothetical protein